ncbi:MAG TPA: hypothetical protein VGE72_03735 [Azospirillum sp.]
MSVILKFRDEQARQTFLERTRRERGDIYARLKPLRVVPHAIAKPTTPEQDDWLRESIGEDGKVYDDVTFTPMAP